MSLSVSLLHRRARLGAIAALSGLWGVGVQAQAQPAAAPTPAAAASASAVAAEAASTAAKAAAEAASVASAVAAPAPPPAPVVTGPASKAAVYQGRFESGCVTMFENTLAFIDVFTVKPLDPKTLSVEMTKVFYSGTDCAPATVMGQVIVPKGKWVLDGQVKLGERMVDRVTVLLPAGVIKVAGKPGPKAKGRVVAEGEFIHLHYGDKETFSVGKMSQEAKEKDLRWLDKGQLFFGSRETPGADGYPGALTEDIHFVRR